MDRNISAEEATILSCERPEYGSHLIDSFYDCPTCAYWLAEAVAQCNEKSCKKCISSLEQSKLYSTGNGEYKSMNNSSSDSRLARDNFEVLRCCDNIKTANSPLNRVIARNKEFIDCQFSACGCNFRTTDLAQLNAHNEENIHRHMNMMSLQITQTMSKESKSMVLNSALNKNENENCPQNGSDGNHMYPNEMKKLHERVAILEQERNDYKLDVQRLTLIINKISVSTLRERSGILVWQIDEFQEKVHAMQATPTTMYYSPDFYTDPNGYRFCGRISISSKSKAKDTLSFHVHMMQSENDFHLDWPFRGCIQIFMIHADSKQTIRDKFMTTEKSTAFQKPTSEISAHSFGFTEYASINNVINEGFLSGDGKLTIKVHISIV